MHRRLWVITAASLLAALLLAHRQSCGDDFFFHLQSWFDAAAQLRQGTLHPQWAFRAAYNAGEPRFVFYPPLSWETGALLATVLPFSWLPAAMAFLIFSIAGFSAYALVRPWTTDSAAVLASCLFFANPYLLLDLISRAAYGQLFATAFFPLLLAAVLRPRASPWRLGLPLALLWLSNVPVGVLGTYLYVLFAIFRLAAVLRSGLTSRRKHLLLAELRTLAGGFVYGLALSAFFLLPATFQRRYIRMQDAFLPHLRVTANLLGDRTLDPVRDFFLLLTQHVAIGLAVATLTMLALAAWRLARPQAAPDSVAQPGAVFTPRLVLLLAALLSVAVLFGITFLSAPLWKHLPALWVVQFPWRLLFALGLCLALAAALLLRGLSLPPLLTAVVALALTAALALLAGHRFHRTCENPDAVQAFAGELSRNHSPDAVNEYVVAGGDNGAMRPDNPPFWLTPDPQAYVPGTTPNLSDLDPHAEAPDAPPGARLSLTPLHFTVDAAAPAFLVINLQDYARWSIHTGTILPRRVHRSDGLVAVPVPAGHTVVDISWHHGSDEVFGWSISALALIAFLLARRGARRSGVPHGTEPPP